MPCAPTLPHPLIRLSAAHVRWLAFPQHWCIASGRAPPAPTLPHPLIRLSAAHVRWLIRLSAGWHFPNIGALHALPSPNLPTGNPTRGFPRWGEAFCCSSLIAHHSVLSTQHSALSILASAPPN